MTTSAQTQSPNRPEPSTSTASYAPDDPRAVFGRALDTAGTVVAAARIVQLGDPTPCAEFEVRGVLEHLVFVLRRVAAMGRGEDAMAVPPATEPVADDAWLDAWNGAVREVDAAWTDDAALERVVTLPWATFPGAGALVAYTSELTTHTWDLATGIGMRPNWDESVVRVALAGIREGLPAEGRVEMFEAVLAKMPPETRQYGYPFAEAVPVPDDAPLIDQLVAYTGRTPR